MTAAVRFADVGFTYNDADRPTLVDVDLEIPEGEFVLVIGPTGSGKSTFLRAISGLVPRFSGGILTGEVEVAGRSTATNHPRDLADVVGTVGQNPAASFVADNVEDELAYVMENLGVPVDTMRRRVEDTLDLLDLADLRRRPLDQLSGGQQQRVAIAAVLAANPGVLVLDEPTSALDPAAADEVLSALQRLVHDLGLTVIMAEHRLERVVQFADSAILIPGNGEPVTHGAPEEIIADPSPRPPVVRLGELVGWEPRPLTVRNARRLVSGLRSRLDESEIGPPSFGDPSDHPDPAGPDRLVRVFGLSAAYGSHVVLRDVEFNIDKSEIVAIMGRNGAGKSTLLAHLAGMKKSQRGGVEIAGVDPAAVRPDQLIAKVGLVPQDSSILLFCETVEEECVTSDRDSALSPGTTSGVLDSLVGGIDRSLHPRDLSEGQRLALALSIILAPAPEVICLDEPTRGLDQDAKAALVANLAALSAKGHTVILATHDVELVAEVAHRVIVLGDAEVVDDGPARRVICHSPVFSPQVARILAPAEWLTVGEVAAALGEGNTR